jgi:hypothetical protein
MIVAKDWFKVAALFCVSVVFVILCFRTPFLMAVVPSGSHLPPVFSMIYGIWVYVVLLVLRQT